ncbi:rhodanese-like domain-containing protein 4A, chloroplastic [Phalaenopsis equestris]|uniref:rhodanese-like domain-containing protein 4A, chloroplastic n=1 Tax=Phalaenopsis equestris TaxID=78828 RepID=UPI0009E2AB16|nr:rhodanese-like domain-containing protein 4A, chloroplastic [Phalaenopsis equestris]
MKSLQNHGLSIKTSARVQTLSPHLSISIPSSSSIRRIPSPPKPLPSLSSNLQPNSLKPKIPSFLSNFSSSHLTNSLETKLLCTDSPSSFDLLAAHLPLLAAVSFPSHCFAAGTEGMSSKISVESVLVSIDDFFNRYPYFVASLAFVWLVVIPLAQEYLKKYKFISSIDAFRKLRDDPSSQLLDIRKKQTVAHLRTPNLKIFNKVAVNLEFVEGCEEEFIKEVLKSFRDPGNTILCVLDNFDGNSLKVAELLFKNGFKEAYAIKGGLLGKDGWQGIQETLLPPSVHVYPKWKSKNSADEDDESRKGIEEHDENGKLSTSSNMNQEVNQNVENGYMKTMKSFSQAQQIHGRPLSPYPNFRDLKPPSSPTPSKP